MAAGVLLPAFVIGRRIEDITLGIGFPQRSGLGHELSDALMIYVMLLGIVMFGVLVYAMLLWPFCRWAPLPLVRVLAVLASPLVCVPEILYSGSARSWFIDYALASSVATLLFGLAVAAGIPDLPRRISAMVRKVVLVPDSGRASVL
jgi:hypothetical protein